MTCSNQQKMILLSFGGCSILIKNTSQLLNTGLTDFAGFRKVSSLCTTMRLSMLGCVGVGASKLHEVKKFKDTRSNQDVLVYQRRKN